MSGALRAVGGHQFSVGPFSSAIQSDDFIAWLHGAAAGDRICYAQGPEAPRTMATWALASEFAASQLITLTCERGVGGFHWYAIKCEARRSRRRHESAADEAMARTKDGEAVDVAIMRLLQRAANFKLPAPTYQQMADIAELPNKSRARSIFNMLIKKGRIAVGDRGGRVIWILDEKGRKLKCSAPALGAS